MSKKISNTEVAKVLGKTYDQINYMQNNNPRDLELIKKGMLYEMVESGEIADILIKKPNKPRWSARLINKSSTH